MSSHLPSGRPTPDQGRSNGSVPAREHAPSRGARVDSRELLGGERELIILHGDQEYRLRHTQNDKLILTK
jgi:hemin uptake protein HemP